MLTVFLVFSMSPVVNTDNQFAVICVFGWHVFTEGRSGFILKNYFAPGFRILSLIPLHKRSSNKTPIPSFPPLMENLKANPAQCTFHMHIGTLQ